MERSWPSWRPDLGGTPCSQWRLSLRSYFHQAASGVTNSHYGIIDPNDLAKGRLQAHICKAMVLRFRKPPCNLDTRERWLLLLLVQNLGEVEVDDVAKDEWPGTPWPHNVLITHG